MAMRASQSMQFTEVNDGSKVRSSHLLFMCNVTEVRTVYATVHACARKRHILLCKIMHSQSVLPWYPAAELLRGSSKKQPRKQASTPSTLPFTWQYCVRPMGAVPFGWLPSIGIAQAAMKEGMADRCCEEEEKENLPNSSDALITMQPSMLFVHRQ
jgi:hypothetical protein